MNAWYETYLSSEEWKDLRRRVLNRDAGRCVLCNRPAECVHHRTYQRVTRESNEDLVSLCADCHDLFHQHYQSGHTHHVPLKDLLAAGAVNPGGRSGAKVEAPRSPVVTRKQAAVEPKGKKFNAKFIELIEEKGKSEGKTPTDKLAKQIINHTCWPEIRGKLLSFRGKEITCKAVKKIFYGSSSNLIRRDHDIVVFSSLWSMAIEKHRKATR